MSPLERRIRALISLFPASFRARWEEDLVRTTLETCTAEQSWPHPRDVLDLVVSAIRAHATTPANQPFRVVLAQGIVLGAALLASVRVGALLLRFGWFVHWLPVNSAAGVPSDELALYAGPLALELVVYVLLAVAMLQQRRVLIWAGALTLGGIGLLGTLRYPGPIGIRWALGMAVPGAIPFLVAAFTIAARKTDRALAVRPALVGLALASFATTTWRLAAWFATTTWHLVPGTVDRGAAAVAALLLVACTVSGFADPRWFIALGVAVIGWNARDFIQTGDPLVFLGTAFVVAVSWVHWRVLRRQVARSGRGRSDREIA
ncbi:hypothetical protein [Polyangium jinanense]|uniref:Uncharacterized protein n=1 Tax=Polyangium jinanense TaxID=2829994 RepID=A0A9X3XCP2_9BACT|nr:hypothetical protein [Polyangium jinanense]MDC3956616.1 hypothetical protein [Polyangium jinanense]MDC3985601.1 hypothetical protein [Polyangium jinanense]